MLLPRTTGGGGGSVTLTPGTGIEVTETSPDVWEVAIDSGYAAPAGSATIIERDLGTPKTSGKFTITDALISAASKVVCWQAPGPYTGKGTRADEASMQPVRIVAVEPASGSATVYWETPPLLTQNVELQNGQRRNIVGATFDRLDNQRWPGAGTYAHKRIGKVSGNVKFAYMILS